MIVLTNCIFEEINVHIRPQLMVWTLRDDIAGSRQDPNAADSLQVQQV